MECLGSSHERIYPIGDRNRQGDRLGTVSACRLKDDGGPSRPRAREGEARFGLEGLKTGQIETVDGDSILWLKNLYWVTLAKRWNASVKILIEQPEDPELWMSGIADGEPAPSFLAWPETQQAMMVLSLTRIGLDQGTGHGNLQRQGHSHGRTEIAVQGRTVA